MWPGGSPALLPDTVRVRLHIELRCLLARPASFSIVPDIGRPLSNHGRGSATMSNVSYLEVKPEMAAKALAADREAKQEFFEKVVEFSKTFSVKETSRLLKISVGWLRTYSAEKGITFPDPMTRSKEEQRAVNRQFEKLRPLKELRKVEPVARALPGQLQLTPELEVLSRRAFRRAKVAFHKRVTELAEVFSLHETAEILNVGVRYLKNYGYDWDIQFCGEQRPYTVSVAENVNEAAIDAIGHPSVIAHLGVDVVAEDVGSRSPTPLPTPYPLPQKATKPANSGKSPGRAKNPFIHAEIRHENLAEAARISRYPSDQIAVGSQFSLL